MRNTPYFILIYLVSYLPFAQDTVFTTAKNHTHFDYIFTNF